MSDTKKPRIRQYLPGDEEAAYFVCMKTGDHGADGEAIFRDDPDALGRIYVGPYLAFEPALSFLLEDQDGVCGYALGTLDSKGFFDRYENEWRPRLVAEFPQPSGDRANWSRIEETHDLYHHPDYFTPEPYAQYPSHCHIDLLERAQSRGFGRLMMERVLDALRDLGSPGVHLGMSASNDRAYGFYRKLGFEELTRTDPDGDDAIYLGLKFTELDDA